MKRRWVAAVAALCLSTGTAHAGPEDSALPDTKPTRVMIMLRMIPPHFRPDAVYAGGYMSNAGRLALRRTAKKIAAEHGLTLVDEWPMPALKLDCFVLEINGGGSAADITRQLMRDSQVESAQPVNEFHVLGRNDPLFPLQPTAISWHLEEVHRLTQGRNIRVAIVDTGVDIKHPDLRDQIGQSRNFVDNGPYVAEAHGTAIAGIISAKANNGVGIVGVAPGAKLLALRACWESARQSGTCNSFTLAKALQFAIEHDVQVINLSLGGPKDPLLERLLDVALAKKIDIVGAYDPLSDADDFPASHPGVLAIAMDNKRFSRNDLLLAPGQDIPTAFPKGGWCFVTGASYAAANVSGIVALLRELRPGIGTREIQQALLPAASSLSQAAPATIDLCSTVARATNVCACNCLATNDAVSIPTP